MIPFFKKFSQLENSREELKFQGECPYSESKYVNAAIDICADLNRREILVN